MKPVRLLPSFAVLLLASACGGGATTNETANVVDATANDMAMNDQLAADNPEEDADAAPVAVAPPPAPPSDLSAGDAAPLAQATEVAAAIESDTTVERVPYRDGWAWRRNGQIIRTASRDGRRVSYYRAGDAAPFFVQDGDQGYAYAGGRPQRAYDRRGRPSQIDAARRAAAQRAVEQSRHDHDEAQHAPSRPDHGNNDRGHDRDRPGGTDRQGGDHGAADHNASPDRGGDHGGQANRPGDNSQRPGTRPDRGDTAHGNRDDHNRPDRRRAGSRDDDQDGNRQAPH